MAEPKRIQLTSVAPVEKDKKKKPKPKTVRINLTLKESTDTTCPEFSYTELTRNEVGDSSQDGSSTNPFGDEDVDVAAIAKKFEEKYAPKTKKGKEGVYKDYYEDLVDLGEGYDEEDPFIDNAEAYDEVVPVCMTTTLGGFYINSGALDFKYQSENSQDDFKEETPVKKKKKVQQITSDTDSEGGEKKEVIKKRKLKDGIEGGLKKKKRLLSSEGKKLNRNKLSVKKFKKKSTPTVADLLKDQSASTSPVEMKTNGDGRVSDLKAGGDNPTIGSTIDSLLEQAMKEDSSQDVEENSKPSTGNPEQIPPLPSNISDSLAAIVHKLKAAATKSGEGKCKFFTSEVNNMLLSIEFGTRLLSCGQRSSVYGHLAAFLPCSKDTLLKRVKKLRMNEVDDMLREPLNKLRDAVNKIMPGLLEKYEAECKIAALARQEEVGNNSSNNNKVEKEDGSTESDDEEKSTIENGSDKTKKRIMGPRRKFEWNSEVRNCLLEVVKAKMQCFDILKSRPTPEEHLKAYLESEVRPIWQTGWMQTRTLYKESKSAHSQWTNPQQKVKKAVITSKSFNSPILTSATVNKTQLDNGANSNISNVVELSGDSHRNSVPTILDYADKVSPTNKLSPNISPNSGPQVLSVKPSSKPSGYLDITKMKDTSKHHLVSEMLQKPLSVVTGNLSQSSSMMSSPKSPHLTNPNPKDSTFFLEFQKHLSKQLSPTSQERLGTGSQPVSSTVIPHSAGSHKTQFKSPTNKYVDTSAKTTSMKTSEALQKQYQSQMNKAHQQARQVATSHQNKRTDQELMAEMQFQKAFIASVQSSKSSPQSVKQFSPQTSPGQSQKVSPTGRDQILAQIQAELVRNDSKLKYKDKTCQNIIEDAVMQQMFKQPLPAANTTSIQQKPLLQQALRGSPVSSPGSSPAISSHRQSPTLAHHSPGSRPMTSLLSSPTSRGIVDLTVDSPPKPRTSPTQMMVKKTSPTNLHQSGSLTHQVQRPGYIVTSPTSVSKSSDIIDRSKVFLQPHSSQQSQGRMTSLINPSANNMKAQWNAAFGVQGVNMSAFTPPVSKTVSTSAKKIPTDQTKTYYQTSASPVSVSYKEVYGIQSSPIAAHQGSNNSNISSSKLPSGYTHTTPSSGYTHTTPSSPFVNTHNHNLLYQQQHALSPSQLQYNVAAAAHLQYQDNSQKHQGQ